MSTPSNAYGNPAPSSLGNSQFKYSPVYEEMPLPKARSQIHEKVQQIQQQSIAQSQKPAAQNFGTANPQQTKAGAPQRFHPQQFFKANQYKEEKENIPFNVFNYQQ